MKLSHAATLIASLCLSVLCGCAPGSFLARANEDCRKYDTPDAQMACERTRRESAKAFDQYNEDKRRDNARTESTQAPENPLCFKASNGDRLCPN